MTFANRVVLVAILVLLLTFTMGILTLMYCGGGPRLARRTVCVASLKGMGTSLLTYAEANRGMFPLASHPEAIDDRSGEVDYTRAIGSYRGSMDNPKASAFLLAATKQSFSIGNMSARRDHVPA